MSAFRSSAGFTEQWEHFDFTVQDSVATLTLNRPDRLNALTFDVYADLRDLLRELPHRSNVEVLVITGSGTGFCPRATRKSENPLAGRRKSSPEQRGQPPPARQRRSGPGFCRGRGHAKESRCVAGL